MKMIKIKENHQKVKKQIYNKKIKNKKVDYKKLVQILILINAWHKTNNKLDKNNNNKKIKL